MRGRLGAGAAVCLITREAGNSNVNLQISPALHGIPCISLLSPSGATHRCHFQIGSASTSIFGYPFPRLIRASSRACLGNGAAEDYRSPLPLPLPWRGAGMALSQVVSYAPVSRASQ